MTLSVNVEPKRCRARFSISMSALVSAGCGTSVKTRRIAASPAGPSSKFIQLPSSA